MAEKLALNTDPTAAIARLMNRVADPLAGFVDAVPDLAMADPRLALKEDVEPALDLPVAEPREPARLSVVAD